MLKTDACQRPIQRCILENEANNNNVDYFTALGAESYARRNC